MSLHIDRDKTLTIAIEQLLGECVAVLGIRGSGKSNTAAVLAEELLGAGLPLGIVDIAGEYWGLKERYQVLVAGRSAHVDVEIAATGGAALAEFSLQHSVPVILDLSEFRKAERFTVLEGFFERLWDLAGELRRPYQIVLEEAHNFIPQSGTTPVNELLVQIAAEGRKRGLGIVMVGQRSSRIDKNVLTQAGIMLLHRVRHPSDIGVYQDLVPKERAWVKQTAVGLQTGQAVVLHGETVSVTSIRERHTFHAGYTPGMDDVVTPDLQTIDADMLASLQSALDSSPTDARDPEKDALRSQVTDLSARIETLTHEKEALGAQVAEQAAEIARLKSQVEMLSQLRVQVEPVQPRAVATMDVGAIQAEQIVTATGAKGDSGKPHPPVQPAPVPPPRAAEPHRSPVATQRAIKKQERRFDTLLKDVRAQAKHHQRILRYLVEREELNLTPRELARYVGYSESTIKNNPPIWMLKSGLLTRDGKPGHRRYTSSMRQLIREQYPDLATDELIAQLLAGIAR